MKRFFFFAIAASALLAACNKTEAVYNEAPQEIALTAVSNVATKTPVDGTDFEEGDNMQVAAYLVDGATAAGNFFNGTIFNKTSDRIWSGAPARYWPITTSTINFLAVTETGGGVDNTDITFDATNFASKATVELSNNNQWDQNDLMYAAGTQTHNEGAAYNSVPMVFKHALSWINFTLATNEHNATVVVNSITLNKAAYNGELTLTNDQYNQNVVNTTAAVDASWDPVTTDAMLVPNADGDGAADPVTLTTGEQLFGNGLLVIPDGGAESFTINYTLTQEDGTALTYNYTHLLTPNWEMAKKYFYNITISLTEILIEPSVTDWGEEEIPTPINGYDKL